ncbi:hypothetical protein [Oleiagrimonas sp. MCCC 1A03011]|uniref:hypothetical protein n=1 Tax=Oleiagrimonas sp. MCCC 1A03011 TaxID=1926883 RepID=UPI0031B61DC0
MSEPCSAPASWSAIAGSGGQLFRNTHFGFHLSGEVVGLNAIYPGRYLCDAIALEETES